MSRPKENNRDWLARHLADLMETGKTISDFDKQLLARNPTYDKGYWTALKLVCLKYYLPVYLNILCRRCNVGYVDPFSGPGLNLVGDRKVPLPGSPLVPLVHHGTDNRFDYHLCGNTDGNYVVALNRRLDSMASADLCDVSRDSVLAMKKDANMLVRNAPNMLAAKNIDHCLLFVDPEGLELDWASLEYFAENFSRSDWMIMFPSAGLRRLMGVKEDWARIRIQRFIGPDGSSLGRDATEEQAIRIFRKNLKNLGKDISMEIAITGTKSFHYHLILAVRETWRKSPWFKSWLEAKNRIEELDYGVVDIVAQQIDGVLKIIDSM